MNLHYFAKAADHGDGWIVIARYTYKDGRVSEYVVDFSATELEALTSAEECNERNILWDWYEALTMNH